MQQYSRPATLADLKALVSSLNRQEAEYLRIGGYALFAHGYHRATTDVDLLVPATRKAGERIKAALMAMISGSPGKPLLPGRAMPASLKNRKKPT
ncbi:MAG TPA: hypothetical protein DGC76_07690 [Candidatus Accumulibacter sp.]|nr:hypothetical protein [Accumulibacter sp.]